MNSKILAAAIGIIIAYGAAAADPPAFATSSTVIYDMAVSPTGQVVFVADENVVKAFDIHTREMIHAYSGGHQQAILSLALSADSSLLASADRSSRLIIRDVTTGEILKTFTRHEGRTLSLAFSPCGKYLASGGTDNRLILYGMETMEVLREIRQHTKGITRVGFSHDGRWLAAAGAGGLVLVADMQDPGRQHLLDEPTTFLRDLDFSHCGTRLSAAGNNGRVYTWRIDEQGSFTLMAARRESFSWITSLQYAPTDPVYVFSKFNGQILFKTFYGRYSHKVQVPVHKLILLQNEDFTFGVLMATRGKGVMHIESADMHSSTK